VEVRCWPAAPHADRSPWADQPRRWYQDSLQKPVGSDSAGDDAQFVAKMVAGGLLRVADGRLSTQGGSKTRREAVVWIDPGTRRSTADITGPHKRAKHAVAGPVHRRVGQPSGASAGNRQACPLTYSTRVRPGGFQVPAPGGRIDGASVFGQYRRITM